MMQLNANLKFWELSMLENSSSLIDWTRPRVNPVSLETKPRKVNRNWKFCKHQVWNLEVVYSAFIMQHTVSKYQKGNSMKSKSACNFVLIANTNIIDVQI